MPPPLGLLWFGFLKAAAVVVPVFVAFSLGPAVWADPPDALRFGGAPHGRADAAALFRAVEGGSVEERQEAARAALSTRFPPGSDAAALVEFLTVGGPDWNGHCEPSGPESGARGYYCLVRHGSFAASVLGLDRWRGREWVVGLALAADSGALERVSVRVPFFGKG